MNGKDEAELTRVLLALDAASLSSRALETAVELAARLHAELHGLFVEDENLLRSAELPFVHQFSVTGVRGGSFDTASVERELKLLAAQAQRALGEAARRSKIHYSFEVVRGPLAAQLAAAATGTDLVVIESRCRPLSRHLSMRAPGRAALFELGRSVLLLEAAAGLPHAIHVVFEGGETGGKALRLAARLAQVAGGELEVLLPVREERDQASLFGEAQAVLGTGVARVRFETIRAGDRAALRARSRGAHAGLLVLPADSPLLAGPDRERFLEELGCPLLVVR
jgi:nucleotide-binding universal stress UspA family protein